MLNDQSHICNHLHPAVDEILPEQADLHMTELTELVYNLAKSGVFTQQNDNVPSWAAFHSRLVSVVNLKVTNAAVNPIIMAPPTD